MKTVILFLPVGCLDSLQEHLVSLKPGTYLTGNFEEVRAMVRENEINRLCIVMGGYNYSGSSSNNIRGVKAARVLHKIKSDLPILVWDGEELGDVRGPEPNTVALDSGGYESDKFFDLTRDFLIGSDIKPGRGHL